MSAQIALFQALRKTVACIDSGDRHLLCQFKLTGHRFYALKGVYENPGISLTALSSLMLIDKSSATRLIRSMEVEGLVRRLQRESDRRTSCLFLSESGKKLFERASAAHDRYAQERFSDLEIDVEGLVRELEAVSARWSNGQHQGPGR